MADELGFRDSGVVPELSVDDAPSYGVPSYVGRARGRVRSRRSPYETVVKRALDLVLAAILIAALAPVFAVVACVIIVVDRRPVFFVQYRVGRDGALFPLFKFRTMVRNAEEILERWKREDPELWQSYVDNNFKVYRDPRVIRFGDTMRRFSLDELPQLWNVLRGDMSLVGPRPLLPEEVEHYAGDMRLYESVRPGITGMWQVSGRSSTTFNERARLDGVYVRSVSFVDDCKLLLRTVASVCKGTGAY